jgi:hypothetical protein
MTTQRSCSPLSPALLALALLLGGALAAEGQTGATCGGIGALKCPEQQACQYPFGQCNQPDLAGVCVPVPATCPKNGPRVCGCDGITYANECELLKAGVRPAKKGACKEEPPKVCKSDKDCTAANSFCEFKAGACGDKGSGRCMVKPELCTQIFAPVCGCDNKTYPNDCTRRAAGVSLKSQGECPTAP